MAIKGIISFPVEITLRLIGAWPNSSCRIFKYIIWTTVMSTFLIFQYSYCLTHVKAADLTDLLDGLSVTFSNTLLLLKFIIVWFHKQTFSKILIIMAEDWDNCKSDWNMEVMMQKAILSYRIAKVMLIVFTCSISLYAVTTFFVPDNIEASHSTEKKFLLRMEFPFEATFSPIYEIIVTIQLVIQPIFTLMAGMFMALIATFVSYYFLLQSVLHVASQIDILCDRLTEILNNHNEEQLRITIIKNLIAKHQRIISLFENVENVFTLISLLQFFFNTVVICFVGFLLVTSLSNGQAPAVIAKCFPYYIAVNFEALILCYTGEYLSSKSEDIGWTVYNSNWYRLSIYETRALLLLILRSQKPLNLTIGKFMNLSLETFANMLKASASYVSVLHAME
ncbi:odorant receptor 67c-like [Bombus pascuorum]|uniref:odorant receptor 67c-like n=1 Tax=Bombus pascuorum TaxID=65598 RepID=UPI00298D6AC4|nr:odorant receptor 67c-like [Bombus pascuorum]